MFDAFRYFTLAVAHGTFTAAARHAHVTQPALTAAIQRLEGELGARLFVRGRGGCTLTAAGEALLPRARAALAAVEDGRRAVAEVSGLTAGSVRVGAGATVCSYYLPAVLARFRAAYPGVQILVREAPHEAILAEVDAGELDLGIVGRSVGELWRMDALVVVAAPGTPTEDAPFVTFPKGSTTRALLDRHFPDARVAMELGGIAAVKGNVRAGVGVALVSERAVERDLASGQLVDVRAPGTPIARPLCIAHKGVDLLPPAAAKLREMLMADAPARAASSVNRRRRRRSTRRPP
ncbi:MAG: LysR family transcriptional regulator [Myxococcales bacterium]|nr:LysR family transcriptional regulator [Myxococcales bacterium]